MPAIREDWYEAEQLHRAAADGNLPEMARLHAAGVELDLFDELSQTPLHYAVEAGQYKAAEWLLAQGANVNARQEDLIGETALSLAVRRDYPEMVELLLKRGADPDLPGWMQLTARIRAHRRRDAIGQQIIQLVERYKPSPANPGTRRK